MDCEKDNHQTVAPHVLILPLPLQGPVSCMLKLAELLCLAGGIHVTFLNVHHFHHRLLRHTDVQTRFQRFPTFHFRTISDGLPENHPRSGSQFFEMMDAMEGVVKPNLREMLLLHKAEKTEPPITCIISDAVIAFALDIAEEIGVPLIYFDTISPCAVWTYLNLPQLIQAGEVPFKDSNLDAKITCIPGMESFLRRRDLPEFCRADNMSDPMMQLALKEAQQLPRAKALILNTFEHLDKSILAHIRALCPNLYVIGPLHLHYKLRTDPNLRLFKIGDSHLHSTQTCCINIAGTETQKEHFNHSRTRLAEPSSSNSLWEEDRSCLAWLDAQPIKSVVYVSIGSQMSMDTNQFMEIWHGLMNSGTRFLWVIRPESITGKVTSEEIPAGLAEGTRKMGCIVSWCPQEEVLAHPAIGGFFTHSGWNSTLESIVAGVPMVCWPHYVDQQVTSRYISEVWKIGMDMKDDCVRDNVEKMVRDVMEVRSDQFRQCAKQMSKFALESVSQGGLSFADLDLLIEDIRLINLPADHA